MELINKKKSVKWLTGEIGEHIQLLTDYTANGSFASLKENVKYYNEENYAVLVRTTDLEKKKFRPERFTDKKGYDFLKKSALYGGEIVLANVGSIGKVYLVPSYAKPMTLAPNMYLIKFDKTIDNIFGYQLISSPFFQKKLKSRIASTTLSAINKTSLKTIKVPIPTIFEQKKIALILSTVDEEIQKTDQIIEKTEKLKNGLMNELLTRGIGHTKFKKTKIGEIPEEWEVTTVGEVCDCIVPGRNKPKIFDGNIPWITVPNIHGSEIQYNNSTKYVSIQELKNCGNKIIPINSVIMSCVGDFGMVVVADKEIAINQQLHAFLPSKQLDQNFLKFLLISQKKYMENLATKTSIPYLNKTSCNSIPIVKPPIEEQLKIAKILNNISKKILSEKTKKNKLIQLKNGLMNDIFNQKMEVNE